LILVGVRRFLFICLVLGLAAAWYYSRDNGGKAPSSAGDNETASTTVDGAESPAAVGEIPKTVKPTDAALMLADQQRRLLLQPLTDAPVPPETFSTISRVRSELDVAMRNSRSPAEQEAIREAAKLCALINEIAVSRDRYRVRLEENRKKTPSSQYTAASDSAKREADIESRRAFFEQGITRDWNQARATYEKRLASFQMMVGTQ
jgi:hypothetical protein